ncbi:hypothetical protein [Amaricoccus sp.]|uniref:hypothetical protein n=1 Tax=Amaricoccus sp. TaxID=1872485 RepID=UPI001B703D62|nr:hypothetical protein [Amaricoccus sp.]MBP7001099.1 hypothetical protein [Amaricoccus sp.]
MAAIAYAISNAPPPPSGFGARDVFAVGGIPADRFDFGGGVDALAPGESSDPLDLIWVVVGGTVDEATLWTSSRSLVAPTAPALAPYFVPGAVVRGTAADDIVLVGARATDVRGGKGNDILYWDPDTGGAPRMVTMDGQAGADTYIIGATTDEATAAGMPGCLITGFQGPGVSSRDKALFAGLDAGTVTAQAEGRHIHFFDGSDHLYLDFRDQNHDRLTRAQIASVAEFGPDRIRLDAQSLFGFTPGDPGGSGPAAALSLVTPLAASLSAYSVAGPVVRGTEVADRIHIGSRATDVRGGKGNDILYWDPDTGGAARMVRMDGQGGADTYVIGATTDEATAATAGGQILDFVGPGVGRRDEVLLGDLDAEKVAAQVEGRYIHFFDGSYHLRLEFLDQNNNALTHERIASMVRFGPESVELAAADFFII